MLTIIICHNGCGHTLGHHCISCKKCKHDSNSLFSACNVILEGDGDTAAVNIRWKCENLACADIDSGSYVCVHVCVCVCSWMCVCVVCGWVCQWELKTVVSCPVCARPMARNSLVNKVKFLGLIPKSRSVRSVIAT